MKLPTLLAAASVATSLVSGEDTHVQRGLRSDSNPNAARAETDAYWASYLQAIDSFPGTPPTSTSAPTGECMLEVSLNCTYVSPETGVVMPCDELPTMIDNLSCSCETCVREMLFTYTGNACEGLEGCTDSGAPGGPAIISFFPCGDSVAAVTQTVQAGDIITINLGGVCLPTCMEVTVADAVTGVVEQTFTIDTTCDETSGLVLKDSFGAIDFVGYTCEADDVNNCIQEVAYGITACNAGMDDITFYDLFFSFDGDVLDLLDGLTPVIPPGECAEQLVPAVIDLCTEGEIIANVTCNGTNPVTGLPKPCDDTDEIIITIPPPPTLAPAAPVVPPTLPPVAPPTAPIAPPTAPIAPPTPLPEVPSTPAPTTGAMTAPPALPPVTPPTAPPPTVPAVPPPTLPPITPPTAPPPTVPAVPPPTLPPVTPPTAPPPTIPAVPPPAVSPTLPPAALPTAPVATPTLPPPGPATPVPGTSTPGVTPPPVVGPTPLPPAVPTVPPLSPPPGEDCQLDVSLNCTYVSPETGAMMPCEEIPALDNITCSCTECVREMQFTYTGNACVDLLGCTDSGVPPAGPAIVSFFPCDETVPAYNQTVEAGDTIIISLGGLCLPTCMDVTVTDVVTNVVEQSFTIDTTCDGSGGLLLKDSYGAIDFVGYTCDESDVNNCFQQVVYGISACNAGATDLTFYDLVFYFDGDILDILNGDNPIIPPGVCLEQLIAEFIDVCTEGQYIANVTCNGTNPITGLPQPCDDSDDVVITIIVPSPSGTPAPTTPAMTMPTPPPGIPSTPPPGLPLPPSTPAPGIPSTPPPGLPLPPSTPAPGMPATPPPGLPLPPSTPAPGVPATPPPGLPLPPSTPAPGIPATPPPGLPLPPSTPAPGNPATPPPGLPLPPSTPPSTPAPGIPATPPPGLPLPPSTPAPVIPATPPPGLPLPPSTPAPGIPSTPPPSMSPPGVAPTTPPGVIPTLSPTSLAGSVPTLPPAPVTMLPTLNPAFSSPAPTGECNIDITVVPECPAITCNFDRCLERPYRMLFRVDTRTCDQSILRRCPGIDPDTCSCIRDTTLTSDAWAEQKFFCTDYDAGPPAAGTNGTWWIKAYPEKDTTVTYFEGPVTTPGGLFNMTAPSTETEVEANSYLELYNCADTACSGPGSILQQVLFHSSCSQQLYLFDIFGSFQLVEFESTTFGLISSFTSPSVGFTIALDASAIGSSLVLDFMSIVVLSDNAELIEPQIFNFDVAGTVIPPSFTVDATVSLFIGQEFQVVTTVGGQLDGLGCFDVSNSTILCNATVEPTDDGSDSPGSSPGSPGTDTPSKKGKGDRRNTRRRFL